MALSEINNFSWFCIKLLYGFKRLIIQQCFLVLVLKTHCSAHFVCLSYLTHLIEIKIGYFGLFVIFLGISRKYLEKISLDSLLNICLFTAEEHQSLCFQKVLTAETTVRLVKEEISSQISVVVNIPQYKRELINQNSSPIHFNNSSVTTHWHAL